MDFVESMLRDMNSNLAAEKPLLSELRDGRSGYRMRDGSEIEVPREQVETLWAACDDSERLRLRVPIYVSTDTSGEFSAWKVEGKAEAAAVARLLGKKIHREGYLRLYNPDLKDLKRAIPDLYLVVFVP
ncbi:MAG: DUF61 family protein [Thermoplasmata archaeon]|nr:DUF61 family protein [Thermoplasmata archaeon]